MEKVNYLKKMEIYMKEILKIIYFMEKENIYFIKLGMNIMGNFNMELEKEKEYINQKINIYLMEIGIMICLAELVGYLIGKKLEY